ncbi:unnamed protein product, partial [Rotaria magnacalcarata]
MGDFDVTPIGIKHTNPRFNEVEVEAMEIEEAKEKPKEKKKMKPPRKARKNETQGIKLPNISVKITNSTAKGQEPINQEKRAENWL